MCVFLYAFVRVSNPQTAINDYTDAAREKKSLECNESFHHCAVAIQLHVFP